MVDLLESAPRQAGRGCKVADVIAAADDPEAADIRVHKFMVDETYSKSALAEWLGVHKDVVGRHREQKCRCFK